MIFLPYEAVLTVGIFRIITPVLPGVIIAVKSILVVIRVIIGIVIIIDVGVLRPQGRILRRLTAAAADDIRLQLAGWNTLNARRRTAAVDNAGGAPPSAFILVGMRAHSIR